MTNSSISIVVYSYKGRLLKNVVEAIEKNTHNPFTLFVIDQHPLIRQDSLLPKKENFFYRHVFWDFIYSPCLYKAHELSTVRSDYVAFLSDDVVLSDGWDEQLIDFIGDRSVVVSGTGQRRVIQKDKFFLGVENFESDAYNLTQYVDRNFVFGKAKDLQMAEYPTLVKYHGEEELFSLELYRSNIDIWSAPTSLYHDSNLRPIENLYVPYSKTHNYNQAINIIRNSIGDVRRPRSTDEFLKFHNIDIDNLKRLPFQYQDVEYDPNLLAFQQVDARKFAAVTKAIY
jgi:hypothetical protein